MKRYYKKVPKVGGSCLICDLYWVEIKKNHHDEECMECKPGFYYKEITEQEYKIRKRGIKK